MIGLRMIRDTLQSHGAGASRNFVLAFSSWPGSLAQGAGDGRVVYGFNKCLMRRQRRRLGRSPFVCAIE